MIQKTQKVVYAIWMKMLGFHLVTIEQKSAVSTLFHWQ
jgi:hypothetical protein